jgi:signal transduction histidine kinase/CheY-like chemotaxis protein
VAPGGASAACAARPFPDRLSLRQRVAAAIAADAVEFDQSKVRVAINLLILLYLLGAAWVGGMDQGELLSIQVMVFLLVPAFAHTAWVLLRPGVNHLRRRMVVWLDMGAVTTVMLLAGETGVMLYCIYPWVVIGNGFRYGRWYLHYSQAVALAGFLAVMLLSAYWRQHAVLGAALLLVLIAIPFYVSMLLARLHAARAQAEAANTAKTKFLAAASHDLRQPMQALSMYASVLQDRVTDPSALRVVHGVKLSVTTLERLFDSVLDISKIESGAVKPSMVAFRLMPLIEQVAQTEALFAAQKGIELRVARTSASVLSDPLLLERMLKNLVINAIRYTEHGGIVVGCRRVGADRLRLEVVDSGIGIPGEEQERIFDDYYQLGGASAQGLGLGLPIVKSLGALLGHAVTVRSALGHGSVFSIELGRMAAPAAPAASAFAAAAALGGTRVVVVDDDVEIRNSMRLLLEGWGCRYIGGATLVEVEQQLRAGGLEPDAVIVDYRLADTTTGLQVIERLRELFGQDLPALVITGTPNASLLQHQLAGIAFAMKPIPPGKVRAFLSQFARRASPYRPR